ncbi:arylsulfatase B-like [Sycon ciliatum]|uniref:arylsulfatase B-like n=1 Tax=Sycon ciliatum TaxID=27933 RepID=UPI0031F66107
MMSSSRRSRTCALIACSLVALALSQSLLASCANVRGEPTESKRTAGQQQEEEYGRESAAGSKPHIVFVLVDDWGYSDVGFRNPAIKSPMFDELASSGVLLDRHYVYKYCSPSRASLMSGRWPHHAHQWNIVPQTVPLGLNLNFTAMPAKLKQAGYATHMVGKWHLGLKSEEYLPVSRGFDTMTGFLTGGEDHVTQRIQCGTDFWTGRAPDTRNGTYDALTYCSVLEEMFSSHSADTPLFLYLALHNVHAPFQAPQDFVDKYAANSTCKQRRMYQAMVSVADNVTALVVQRLKEKGMWNNTLLVVSSDNGAAPCAGSNYPLKGSKLTFFEGGVRASAFANGGLLPAKMSGTKVEGYIHIADWYPTFCKLAGVDPDDSGPGRFPVDGHDVWPLLSGESTESTHDDIILGFNYSDYHPQQGAIIVGDYKLIVGAQKFPGNCDSLMHPPIDYPCSKAPEEADCDPMCLYDIRSDPRETHDLYKSQPAVVQRLLHRYMQYADEPRAMQDQGYHSRASLPNEADVACAYFAKHGGYWRPWHTSDSAAQLV